MLDESESTCRPSHTHKCRILLLKERKTVNFCVAYPESESFRARNLEDDFFKTISLRLSTCCMFLISKCTTSRGAGAVRHNARTCELLVWINFVLRLLSLHLTRTEALPRLFCSRRAFSRSEERPHGLYDSYFVENPFTPRSEKEILLGNLQRKKLCRVYQMRSGIALPEETRLGILLTEVHYLN